MSGSTILVADGSEAVRAVLNRQLAALGHSVVEAADGADVVRVCFEQRPRLVLLDIAMPALGGHAVLSALRDDPELCDIPVVFLTAGEHAEDIAEGLRQGAHDYLRKPFEPPELLARVTAALRFHALHAELRARNEELGRISRADSLTGLHNRRHLEERLAEMLSAARRHGQGVGVLMVDIDHFKVINATHGRAAGDLVLRALANRLRDIVRTEDAVGRWGGGKLVALVEDASPDGIEMLAERIRVAAETTQVSAPAGATIPVSASIGCSAGAGAAETLVRNADMALYAAKAAGRNRVMTAF